MTPADEWARGNAEAREETDEAEQPSEDEHRENDRIDLVSVTRRLDALPASDRTQRRGLLDQRDTLLRASLQIGIPVDELAKASGLTPAYIATIKKFGRAGGHRLLG